MLVSLKNNRSLTFFQHTATIRQTSFSASYAGGISSVAIANTSMITSTNTTTFNLELHDKLEYLNSLRARDIARLDLSAPNPTARNTGVSRAWQYEQADIEMGGKGSAGWNKSQRLEIRETGKVRGAEGHHQQNVSDHPEQQANPDNINFFPNREEHLEKGHGGNWDNETNAPLIDKNEMLENTNACRVYKNELRGFGLAVAIGAGVGMTIGFAVTLAQSGVTPESLKLAIAEGAKAGSEAGILSAFTYGIGRTIGEVATKAVSGLLANLGITITENISKMCNIGVVGALTIAVFSAYQFIKLKRQGIATRDALMQIGKQALFSLSLLAVSLAVQGIWGGPAGIIVSLSFGIILISYTIVDTVKQRRSAEKIRIYVIDKCLPAFST